MSHLLDELYTWALQHKHITIVYLKRINYALWEQLSKNSQRKEESRQSLREGRIAERWGQNWHIALGYDQVPTQHILAKLEEFIKESVNCSLEVCSLAASRVDTRHNIDSCLHRISFTARTHCMLVSLQTCQELPKERTWKDLLCQNWTRSWLRSQASASLRTATTSRTPTSPSSRTTSASLRTTTTSPSSQKTTSQTTTSPSSRTPSTRCNRRRRGRRADWRATSTRWDRATTSPRHWNRRGRRADWRTASTRCHRPGRRAIWRMPRASWRMPGASECPSSFARSPPCGMTKVRCDRCGRCS
jgi:hypothetical protein